MSRAMRFRVLAGVLGAASLLGATTACEDPIIVVGDLPGIMRRVAGIPDGIGSDVDSLAILTRLHEPRGLAVGADGTLYIADTRNARIVAVSPSGVTDIVASDVGCSDACLVAPYDLAMGSGSLWIADRGAHRVFRLDPVSGLLEVVAGTGVAGNSPDGIAAVDAALAEPTGIGVSSGTPYFSERGGHRIRWVHSSGTIHTIAGTGEAGHSGDGGPATSARLNRPAGMTIRGSTLYFADEENHRVRSVSLTGGVIRTVAGNGVAGYAETDSIAPSAKLNAPTDVVVTADGRQVLIADARNHRIRAVDVATGRISRFAGTGDPGFSGEGGDAADTSLETPAGLAVHVDGTVFIADTGHHIVWRTTTRF